MYDKITLKNWKNIFKGFRKVCLQIQCFDFETITQCLYIVVACAVQYCWRTVMHIDAYHFPIFYPNFIVFGFVNYIKPELRVSNVIKQLICWSYWYLQFPFLPMISKLFEKIELSKLRCQTIVLLFLSRFPPPLFLLYVINFTRRGPFFVCWQHSHTQRIYIWRIILLTKICRSTLHWNRYLYIMQWVLKLWLQSLYLYHGASITSNHIIDYVSINK